MTTVDTEKFRVKKVSDCLDKPRAKLQTSHENHHSSHTELVQDFIRKIEHEREKVVDEGREKIEQLKQLDFEKAYPLDVRQFSIDEALMTLKCDIVSQIQSQKAELISLQQKLLEERQDLSAKQNKVKAFRCKEQKNKEEWRHDVRVIKTLISQEDSTLSQITREHDDSKREPQHESDSKLHSHQTFEKQICEGKSNTCSPDRDRVLFPQSVLSSIYGETQHLVQSQEGLDKPIKTSGKVSRMCMVEPPKTGKLEKVQGELNHMSELRAQQDEDIKALVQEFKKKHSAIQDEFVQIKEKLEEGILQKQLEAQKKQLLLQRIKAENAQKLSDMVAAFHQDMKQRGKALLKNGDRNRLESELQVRNTESDEGLDAQCHEDTLKNSLLKKVIEAQLQEKFDP